MAVAIIHAAVIVAPEHCRAVMVSVTATLIVHRGRVRIIVARTQIPVVVRAVAVVPDRRVQTVRVRLRPIVQLCRAKQSPARLGVVITMYNLLAVQRLAQQIYSARGWDMEVAWVDVALARRRIGYVQQHPVHRTQIVAVCLLIVMRSGCVSVENVIRLIIGCLGVLSHCSSVSSMATVARTRGADPIRKVAAVVVVHMHADQIAPLGNIGKRVCVRAIPVPHM